MSRLYLLIASAAMTLLVACGTPHRVPVPVPSISAARVAVEFKPHSQWTPQRMAKIREAASLLEAVLNQPAFAEAVAARTDFQRDEGFSPRDILRLLRAGLTLPEARSGVTASRPVTLALAISPASGEFSRDAGFTDLDTLIIYIRRDWLDTQPLCAIAGLLAHEHMHVMGFTHTAFNHPWRRRSVPYAVGDMVAAHAQSGCVMKDERT